VLTRGLGDLGGVLGVGMHLDQREMPVGEPQVVAQAALHRFHDRIGVTAMRALEAGVLDERHGRVIRAQRVIARTKGRNEAAQEAAPARAGWDSSSSAARMPSAPGFCVTGER